MPKKVKASHLYKQGRFNYAHLDVQADGTTVVVCDGEKAPAPYTFRARRFLEIAEQLLDDPELELADEPVAHPEPAEG